MCPRPLPLWLNVTVTDPASAGFVTVYPCGGTLPTTSSVNFVAGQTVANAVITKTSPTRTVCLSTSTGTHLIADINGSHTAGAERSTAG